MSEKKNLSPQQVKELAVGRLDAALDETVCEHIEAIDPRLLAYFRSLTQCSTGATDQHNLYEVLCGLRFMRLFRLYGFDVKKVQQVIRLREGRWHQEGRRWVHDGGGLAQPSMKGEKVFRWEPFQIFILASTFGFKAFIDTGAEEGDRDMLPTEAVGPDGHIYDMRRLCTDFTFYSPRKVDKTGMAAYIQVVFFLLEDADSQIFCAANSADQSKILYERTRKMLSQLDPEGQRIRQTATVCDWRPAYKSVRDTSIRPLTAGGKTKDGLMASLVCCDEYGSAAWIKNRSGMKQLIDVVESSMGPRREPLSFTTTTAGTITAGPFIEKLATLHKLLDDELKPRQVNPTMPGALTDSNDRTLCLLLEPDQWERDEETMLTSHALWHKVNPMLGKIVQTSFYEDWAAKVRRDPTNLPEYVTKLMNVYHTDAVQEWISAEHVRALQVDARIDDCKYADGWVVFAGMDFSLGDDLHALSYLAFNTRTREFFADCDSWLTEHSLEVSPMRDVFLQWVDKGWLHTSPGSTLNPELPVSRIAELTGEGVNIMLFLYDPYKATQPINALSAYVYSLGVDPKQVVLPCRQNYATFSPLVLELDFLVKNDPPLMRFSQNPLWPWEAGNMILDVSTDGMENRKPRKRSANSKIDNFICLLMGLKGYDLLDGKEHEV